MASTRDPGSVSESWVGSSSWYNAVRGSSNSGVGDLVEVAIFWSRNYRGGVMWLGLVERSRDFHPWGDADTWCDSKVLVLRTDADRALGDMEV